MMISHSVEISITGGVREKVRVSNYYDFFILFLFLNHMFIVPTVQEVTCILMIWPKQN